MCIAAMLGLVLTATAAGNAGADDRPGPGAPGSTTTGVAAPTLAGDAQQAPNPASQMTPAEREAWLTRYQEQQERITGQSLGDGAKAAPE